MYLYNVASTFRHLCQFHFTVVYKTRLLYTTHKCSYNCIFVELLFLQDEYVGEEFLGEKVCALLKLIMRFPKVPSRKMELVVAALILSKSAQFAGCPLP